MQMPETVSSCRRINASIVLKYCILVLAWNYRRYVLASMPIARPESAELAYTSRKIEANFSNFSAWHQRSKTLTSLWEQGKLDEAKSREQGKASPFEIHLHSDTLARI